LSPGEYLVEIARPPNTSLGLDFEATKDGMTILEVNGGLVQEWNFGSPSGARVNSGDTLVEVNGVRGAGRRLVEEIKKSRELRLVFRRAGAPAAAPAKPAAQATGASDAVLAELDKAEEAVYGAAFAEFGGNDKGVMVDNAGLRAFVLKQTCIREENMDEEMVKMAPELRISLSAFLSLIRQHTAPDEPAIASFMELTGGGDSADGESCIAGLPRLLRQVLGSNPKEKQEWWARIMDAARGGITAGQALDLQRYMACYRRAARVVRLTRYAGQ